MKAVFLDYETLDQEDLDLSILTSTLEDWDLWATTTNDECVPRIAKANIVVTNKVRITADIMQQAPMLRCICVAATGTDNVDLEAAKARSITVCNIKGYSTSSVVQHTIGLMLMMFSRLGDYTNLVREGAWVEAKHFCLPCYKTHEVEGKILGIIGYGAIGKAVAKVAEQLGMKIRIATRVNGKYELASFLPEIDVLSLHCPLTLETQQIIGADEIALMKPGSFLINVSRGGLVNETALSEALLSSHLAGAALDVISKEPPSADSILFSKKHPHLLITPHVAWATAESRNRLLHQLKENIQQFLNGTPINLV